MLHVPRKTKPNFRRFRIVSFWICTVLILTGITESAYSDKDINGSAYDIYQGQWDIESIYLDHDEINFSTNTTGIDVLEDKFFFLDPSGEYLEANELGGLPILLDPKKPARVMVFWYRGLVAFDGGVAELVLKYSGQGVEGKTASKWRHPKDFIKRPGQDHYHIVLKKRE